MEKWEVLRSEPAYSNKFVHVRKDVCRTPAGEIVDDYYVVVDADVSIVFCMTEDEKVILGREYKHGIKQIVTGLLGGKVSGTEDTKTTAKRELLEETGFKATSWKRLASYSISSARMPTIAHYYLAIGAKRVMGQDLDEHEQVDYFLVTVPELWKMLKEGKIEGNPSVTGCFLALEELGYLNFGGRKNA